MEFKSADNLKKDGRNQASLGGLLAVASIGLGIAAATFSGVGLGIAAAAAGSIALYFGFSGIHKIIAGQGKEISSLKSNINGIKSPEIVKAAEKSASNLGAVSQIVKLQNQPKESAVVI
jgi:hypothetical protein